MLLQQTQEELHKERAARIQVEANHAKMEERLLQLEKLKNDSQDREQSLAQRERELNERSRKEDQRIIEWHRAEEQRLLEWQSSEEQRFSEVQASLLAREEQLKQDRRDFEAELLVFDKEREIIDEDRRNFLHEHVHEADAELMKREREIGERSDELDQFELKLKRDEADLHNELNRKRDDNARVFQLREIALQVQEARLQDLQQEHCQVEKSRQTSLYRAPKSPRSFCRSLLNGVFVLGGVVLLVAICASGRVPTDLQGWIRIASSWRKYLEPCAPCFPPFTVAQSSNCSFASQIQNFTPRFPAPQAPIVPASTESFNYGSIASGACSLLIYLAK